MRKNYKEVVPEKRLRKSKEIRAELISKLGFMPLSVLPNMKDKKFDERFTKDIIAEEERSYIEHNYNVRDGALSRFPTRIGVFAIQFWSEHGDTIWDPCMGRGQRAAIAHKLGRHYIGTDICKEFYDTVVENFKKMGKRTLGSYKVYKDSPTNFMFELNGTVLELILADSKTVKLQENHCSLTFTSPPYWDIEFYDDHPEQLGTGKTYEEYLEGMKGISANAYKILKPGGYCIYAINDFRKDGRFYLLHSDLMHGMMDVGFEPHDIVIYQISAHPLGAIFASQLEERRVTAKCHEYLIVGKKPLET